LIYRKYSYPKFHLPKRTGPYMERSDPEIVELKLVAPLLNFTL